MEFFYVCKCAPVAKVKHKFADAYAGINAFGAGADRFTAAVNEKMDQLHIGRYRAEQQENGVRETNGPNKNTAQMDGERYSIVDPFTDNNGTQFDSAVLLDTHFFDGLSPRNWGSKLRDFIEMRADSDPFILPVLDENGNVQQLQFADAIDRVSKNGGAEHKVLNELASGSDNISKLAVIHIDEIVDVSQQGNPYYTSNNEHGWLDRKGWLHRTANVINAQNGNIYNLTFDIAKADDGRHILYATKGKIKRVGNANVNSLKIRGSKLNSNSANNVAQIDPTVKRKDMEYQYAVSRGDLQTAKQMVDEAAKDHGYTAGDDWRMSHRAPNRNSGVTIDKADEVYGGDGSIRSPWAYRYYGEGRPYDVKAIMALSKAWKDPDGSLKVYRAVPTDVEDGRLRNGDWVSPTREYAQEHGERYFEDGFRILEQNVPVKHLYVDGNSIHEYGYDNGRDTEVYKNTRNNVKLAEVTYDDAGHLIPLSKRYDDTVSDERYSVDEDIDTADFAAVQAAMNAQSKEWNEMYLRNQLGDEGYKKYQVWEKEQQTQKKQESKERAKQRNAEKQAARKSVTKPVAESKPIEAKKELRGHKYSN